MSSSKILFNTNPDMTTTVLKSGAEHAINCDKWLTEMGRTMASRSQKIAMNHNVHRDEALV